MSTPVPELIGVDEEYIRNLVSEMADDGDFTVNEVAVRLGVKQSTIRKRAEKKFSMNISSMIRRERIMRLVAMAEAGKCTQELAASLVGWDKVTASVALKKDTGKTFMQIRKEHFLSKHDK